MNWKVMGVGMVLSVPLIWALAQGFSQDPRALPQALTGQAAPDFSLESLDGHQISLKDLKGSPAVLNFWASWCQPCLIEHPGLVSVAKTYKGRGVVFLGILYGDNEKDARSFLKRHGTAYPTLVDVNQRSAIDYGIAGVPETYVLDKDGIIVKKYVGPVSSQELSALLDGLL